MVRLLDIAFESRRKFTQEEFFEFCLQHERDAARYELLDGKIVMNPPAGYPHGEVASIVNGVLRGFVRPGRLGKVFDSSQGFALPSGDTVAPDASFVSTARWEAAPRPVPGKFLKPVPDLVVEIRSQSNTAADMKQKRMIYEKNGVRELWCIDPFKRKVELFVLTRGKFGAPEVAAPGATLASHVLPGLEVQVGELFE
ncbi:MAG: Uma2 family endonuclease [Candidatus Sericytochromatia bacterium]|nr:Uma2 family endonuclease [Candidatus Tanganyikabacteria bacterium]